MKKLNLLLLISLLTTQAFGQNKEEGELNNYLRSSLYTIILDDHGLMDADKATIIKNTFFNTPLPEKFNDHNIDPKYRTFDPKNYTVTEDELALITGEPQKKKKKGGFGKSLGKFTKGLASDASAGLVDTTDTKQLPGKFIKYFEESKIPNQIISKWYNLGDFDSQTNSFFDMELIKERGLYNATEFDKNIAEKSTRGMAMLADAGEKLIKNTFVVGLRFNYVDKEKLAEQVAATSSVVTGLLGSQAAAITNAAVSVGASVAGKGYVIKTTAFLYQLNWTEDVANQFYTEYYNTDNLDEFSNTDIFTLKYLGEETAWADIQSSAFSKKTDEELVERATVRAIDNAIAKLQRKYEPFRTITPLLTTEPEITAQIGLKEDLEGGDKYEVLEKIQDPETNITTYKRVAVIKVDKNKIWDNRFAADVEQAENQENDLGETQEINATHFKGSSKHIYPGMLIRQID